MLADLLFAHASREPSKNVVYGDAHPVDTGFATPRFDCDPGGSPSRVPHGFTSANHSTVEPVVAGGPCRQGVHEIAEPGPFSRADGRTVGGYCRHPIASSPRGPFRRFKKGPPRMRGLMVVEATKRPHHATALQETYRLRRALGRAQGTPALIANRLPSTRAPASESFRDRGRSGCFRLVFVVGPFHIIRAIVDGTTAGVGKLRQHQDSQFQ